MKTMIRQMTKLFLNRVCLFVILVSADFGMAQQTLPSNQQQPSLVLDVQQAIQYAIEHNPNLLALQKRKSVADAEVQIAGQRNNPSFVGEDTRSQPNYFVGAGYVFELGDKRKNRIEVAKNESQVAQLGVDSGLRTVRHDVRVAFYTMLELQDKRNQITASRDLAKQLLDISNERFKAGDVARFEVLQAELEMKRRENDSILAENDLQSSVIELNTFLNRAPQDPLELKGAVEEKPEIASLDSLVDQAISKQVQIQTLEQERKAEEARLALARSERVPDLDIEAGTEIHDADFQYGWRAALRLELPLLNQKKGEIARSQTTLESIQMEETAFKQGIRARVSQAYLKFQALQNQADNYRNEILPTALEIEQLSQESYHQGRTGILSAIDAQRAMHETKLEYLAVLLDLQVALADLELASGVDLQ
jgi:outer membrane protein, heavy metal efflux system